MGGEGASVCRSRMAENSYTDALGGRERAQVGADFRLVSPIASHYTLGMKATLTSKGQITIPTEIRRRLGLHPGQVLEFDEESPYILAVPVFDEGAMRAVIGCTRGRLGKTSAEWLDETRGRVGEKD